MTMMKDIFDMNEEDVRNKLNEHYAGELATQLLDTSQKFVSEAPKDTWNAAWVTDAFLVSVAIFLTRALPELTIEEHLRWIVPRLHVMLDNVKKAIDNEKDPKDK